ncbi:acid phosphatase [Methylobacterium organophilum]|uniref:Acid phosphatase n=1 Tax=Methylobacterium organophilum TaxID=410 RepID=A0ABQ4T4C2_METOR|nr:phosphatase PAP2 family protein [Methylobacterium organophilum]GJE25472.1 hypothetical protein LKMONMHP_0310 [Methylobacterium organophilum]
MPRLSTFLAALLTAIPMVASAAPETAAPSVGADRLKAGKPAPYLDDTKTPDILAILPPPPAGHSAAEAADRAAFNATRAYNGTERWALATADVADGASAILSDFSCVLGQRIDQARFPDLMNLLERVRVDIARSTRSTKRHYRRLRPFIGNDSPICVVRSPELADSFSYPSGHSTQGWAYALIMAQLVPEKATQFMVRGRVYGESRVVCGVHWMSDVEAARMAASALVAALQGNADFRRDLERARADLTKALASAGEKPDPAICSREDAAARTPLL